MTGSKKKVVMARAGELVCMDISKISHEAGLSMQITPEASQGPGGKRRTPCDARVIIHDLFVTSNCGWICYLVGFA